MSATASEEIHVGEMTIRFLTEGSHTDGALAVFQFDVPTGAMLPEAHSHDGYDETIYGLSGALTWTLNGTPTNIDPGEVLFIPRGTVHSFANTGDADASALAIITPGILGPEFFREIAAIFDAAVAGPPDFAAIGAVMRHHGLTPAA